MTLTLAGNKQLKVKRSSSTRDSTNNWKTAKTSNLNSQPVLSPPMLPSRSVSPGGASHAAGLSSSSGTSGTQVQPRGEGMSAAPIALQAPMSSTNARHSIGTRDSINCPMNIVRDTPEPYLEPIKLLNKQSIEERQQNPTSATRSPISGVPSEKTVTLKQLTKSCFTGARFPSASSRPIPPPKVLLKRQQSTREEVRKTQRPSERKATVNNLQSEEGSAGSGGEKEGAKRRELAYLIVDLNTGRTTISTKNKRTFDDSDVGLKSRKRNSSEDKSSRIPVRSFTMSIPGDQVKRPVVKPQLKPRPTRKTSQDSLKASPQQSPDGIATIHETTISSSGEHSHSPEPSVTTEINRSHDHHHHHGNLHRTHSDLLKKRPEIYVSTSTGDSDEERWETKGCSAPAPPPIPPKRGLGKMVSLPQAASASRGAGGHGLPADAGGRLLRGGRTSLPASSISKDLQQVSSPSLRSDLEDPLTSSTETEKASSGSHPKPTKNRLPPPKPRPYSERVISPPPPPSFPPPPRPVASTTSQPTSPTDSRRTVSPVPPPKSSKTPPLSPNMGMRLSHSQQSLVPPGVPSSQARGSSSPRNRVLSDSTSKSSKPKHSKPSPPSRPPPANSKLSQLIAEHRSRSKSTVSSKGSPPTTNRVKPSISGPRLISTTMKSDSQSLTDLRIQAEPEIEEDTDVIPCSNISYVSSTELLGGGSPSKDRPTPLYEDIDAVIPLPPPRNEVHKPKVSHHSPLSGKKSSSTESTAPELPPKNCYLDNRGRRRTTTSPVPLPVRAKSPLTKTLSSNSSHAHTDTPLLSSPDSPTEKELREIDESEESKDAVEPYYVKKVVPSEEEEEQKRQRQAVKQDTGAYEQVGSPLSVNEEEPQEPDVGGVEEYVMMSSVINGAWETEDGSEKMKTKTEDKDHPEESYVEMQPVAVSYPNSPSPSGEDISRNFYELDDEPEPVYIEMNPEEFVPPNKLYYASKDLLSHRPDLQAKKKKSKKLFHIRK